MSALALEAISKQVRSEGGDKAVLRSVSLQIDAGSFVVLTGRSGAGKSSLLSIAGGLDREYEGRALVAGHEWKSMNAAQAARVRNKELGFVFQIPRLFASFSVWRNATAPAWISGARVDDARITRLLQRVGLGAAMHRAVTGLSGGERQRLTIARALVNRPALLLCDEPTGNLDAETGGEILNLLLDLRREEALTLFVVTHDPTVIARADRVVRMADGGLIP